MATSKPLTRGQVYGIKLFLGVAWGGPGLISLSTWWLGPMVVSVVLTMALGGFLSVQLMDGEIEPPEPKLAPDGGLSPADGKGKTK